MGVSCFFVQLFERKLVVLRVVVLRTTAKTFGSRRSSPTIP